MLKCALRNFAVAAMLGPACVAVTGPVFAADVPGAAQLEEGKVLFQSGAVPACAICHTLEDADATGGIGPNLDELKPDMQRVLQALKSGLGPMPSYESVLSEDEMNAVAAYVANATK